MVDSRTPIPRTAIVRPTKPLSMELVERVRDGLQEILFSVHKASRSVAADDAAKCVEQYRTDAQAFAIPTGAEFAPLKEWLAFTLERPFDGWEADLRESLNALRRLTPGLQGQRDTPADVRNQVATHLAILEAAGDVLSVLFQGYNPDVTASQAEVSSAGEQPKADALANAEKSKGEPTDAALRKLSQSTRLAYLSFQAIEVQKCRRLEDREAYDLLSENGLPTDKGPLGVLADYKLPSFDTWTRYLRDARQAMGDSKYTQRAGRSHGSSIAKQDEV